MNNFSLKTNAEIQKNKPKAVLILWALWSWKTTFLNNLLNKIDKSFNLIINDVWSINIDSTRFWDNEVEALTNWCVCCDWLQDMIDALEKYKSSQEILFIEPSWIAEGINLSWVIKKAWYDLDIITLVDVKHFSSRTFEEKIIMETQARVADLIGYTWYDEENLDLVNSWVEKLNKKAKRINISKKNDDFWKKFLEEIINSKKSLFKIFPENNKNTKNPLSTKSMILDKNFSLENLYTLISAFEDILIRAKGVINWYEFDFVHWSLEIWNKTKKSNQITIISTKEISQQDLDNFINITKENMREFMIYDLQNSLEKITNLVDDYHTYMDLENNISKLKWLLDLSKNNEILDENRLNTSKILDKINILQLRQKTLWESMKYDNPFIWLDYKIKAYEWSEKSITTIKDLLKHCESPTYICHKRLQFLAKILKNDFNIDVFDEKNLDLNIYDLIKKDVLSEIITNNNYMKIWFEYEYFEVDGRVAKWENFNV